MSNNITDKAVVNSAELPLGGSANGVSESCTDNKVNQIVKILDGMSVAQIQTILKDVENYVMLLPLQTNY